MESLKGMCINGVVWSWARHVPDYKIQSVLTTRQHFTEPLTSQRIKYEKAKAVSSLTNPQKIVTMFVMAMLTDCHIVIQKPAYWSVKKQQLLLWQNSWKPNLCFGISRLKRVEVYSTSEGKQESSEHNYICCQTLNIVLTPLLKADRDWMGSVPCHHHHQETDKLTTNQGREEHWKTMTNIRGNKSGHDLKICILLETKNVLWVLT